jgi:two-component system sensor kinase FixL
VLDTADDGIIIVDEQARVLMFNKACEWLFGYAAADVLGVSIKTILPPENAEERDGYIWEPSRGGIRDIKGIWQKVMGRHRDGTVFPIELSVSEAITQDGRKFIAILRDRRSRHEFEQQLNQLQVDLLRMARASVTGQMGGAFAHELNQLLTALVQYLQVVEGTSIRPSGATGPPQSSADIPMAVDPIKHGALNFSEKPFDVNTVVARVREAIEAWMQRAKNCDGNILPEYFSGHDLLTPREREVLGQIASGASNKESGRKLGISPRTIEVHRARIMEKLGAKNAADLVRIVLSDGRVHSN